MSSPDHPRVAFLVTCLVDFFRPSVGFAAVRLLEAAGCTVEVPARQTCCGQPAWNSGDRATARRLARQVIETFGVYDHVVLPSGSCAAMIKVHYPELFADDPPWQQRARNLAERTFELTSFLVDVLGVEDTGAHVITSATFHDSCHGLRELGIQDQPRKLLAGVAGLELREMEESTTCCGFGGTFCMKYPEISAHMATTKAVHAGVTGAKLLLGGDLGCLLNLAGQLKRQGSPMRVRHVAEVLAGVVHTPAIGEGKEPL